MNKKYIYATLASLLVVAVGYFALGGNTNFLKGSVLYTDNTSFTVVDATYSIQEGYEGFIKLKRKSTYTGDKLLLVPARNYYNGTSAATYGTDYFFPVTTVQTFSASESVYTIYIPTNRDSLVEGAEKVYLHLFEKRGSTYYLVMKFDIEITDPPAAPTEPDSLAVTAESCYEIGLNAAGYDISGTPALSELVDACVSGEFAGDYYRGVDDRPLSESQCVHIAINFTLEEISGSIYLTREAQECAENYPAAYYNSLPTEEQCIALRDEVSLSSTGTPYLSKLKRDCYSKYPSVMTKYNGTFNPNHLTPKQCKELKTTDRASIASVDWYFNECARHGY